MAGSMTAMKACRSQAMPIVFHAACGQSVDCNAAEVMLLLLPKQEVAEDEHRMLSDR